MTEKKVTYPNFCERFAHARGLIESVLRGIMGKEQREKYKEASSSRSQYFNSILSHKLFRLLSHQVFYLQKSYIVRCSVLYRLIPLVSTLMRLWV